jgi:hypothetical protein
MADAALKWPQTEIQKMEEGAERFLTNDVNRASWERWKIAVITAVRDTENSRKAFYILRTIALISAITVPSLVGLNLSGTGGSVGTYSEIVWLLMGRIASTRVNARQLTGLPNTYLRCAVAYVCSKLDHCYCNGHCDALSFGRSLAYVSKAQR